MQVDSDAGSHPISAIVPKLVVQCFSTANSHRAELLGLKHLQGRPSEDNGRGAVGAVRQGGDDVEWAGKALRVVGAERVWGSEWGSVGEALKAVWVVGSVGGWRCSELLKPVTSFGREDKQKPTLREGGGGGRGLGTHWKPQNPNQRQPGGDNGRDRTKGGQVGTMAKE